MRRRLAIPFVLFLFALGAPARSAGQEEVDKEIMKDLDFFYYMDAVEAEPLLEEESNLEGNSDGNADSEN